MKEIGDKGKLMCHGHTATHSLTHSRDRFEDEEREREARCDDVASMLSLSLSLSLSPTAVEDLLNCTGLLVVIFGPLHVA